MMSTYASGSLGNLLFASIASMAALVACTERAEAVPIAVPNGGFESSVLSNGGVDLAPIPDWNIVVGSLGQQGAFNPTDSQFSGTTAGPVPSPGEGTDIALSNLSRSAIAGSDFSTFTSAASLATVQGGATYTLRVAFGRRATGFLPDQYQIEMLLDDVAFAPSLATLNGNTIAADSFVDLVTAFTATSAEAGSTLKIRITHSTLAGSGTVAGHFDNVRLEFTPPPIPEPSTFLLLGFGAFGLMCRTRRCRRRA